MNYLDWLNISGTWWVSITLWVLILAAAAILIRFWFPIRSFTSEVKVELQKASWPWDPKEKGMKRYKELVDSTVIVLIATLLMGGYVAGWDFLLNVVLGFLLKTPVS
jgi:preprotein translocase subunit SecE